MAKHEGGKNELWASILSQETMTRRDFCRERYRNTVFPSTREETRHEVPRGDSEHSSGKAVKHVMISGADDGEGHQHRMSEPQ